MIASLFMSVAFPHPCADENHGYTRKYLANADYLKNLSKTHLVAVETSPIALDVVVFFHPKPQANDCRY